MHTPTDKGLLDDPLIFGAMVVAVLGLLVAGFWWEFHPEISYWTAWAYWWVWAPVERVSHSVWVAGLRGNLASLAAHAATAEFDVYSSVTWIPSYAAAPIVLGVLWRAWRAMARTPWCQARRVVDAKTLPWILAKVSPSGIPALYFPDLLKNDPEDLRSAMTPDEWASDRKVVINSRLDHERTRVALERELGPVVNGPDDLLPHERAILAALAPRITGEAADYPLSQDLFDDLNRSCHTGTFKGQRGFPELHVTEAAFQRFRQHPRVLRYFEMHRYARTVLYAMHVDAIRRGRLPTSNFVWLKRMDRGLWYALETSGRTGPFAEALAVFTQARWEEYVANLGSRLEHPHLGDAVKSLELYLAKHQFISPLGKKKKAA